jgi:hypothetical protein
MTEEDIEEVLYLKKEISKMVKEGSNMPIPFENSEKPPWVTYRSDSVS